MSEQTNTDVITDLDDSFFAAYANKIKSESERKTGGGGFTPREYDTVGYAGLESGNNKIFRLIGAPPGAETLGYKRKPYDPIQIMMCEVKDDNGKKFVIKLPLREDEVSHNHILHRLYDKVTEVVWVNKKKTYVNEVKYPDLWKKITKTGYNESDGKSWQMAAGLKATVFSIFNVIDRQDDWCEKNKHTKILCREVNIDDKGNVWAKPGIKSWGLLNRLRDLQDKYKNYEMYDIAIKRTGQKDNPIELRNASEYKKKDMMTELVNADGTIPEESIIIIGPMTADEKAYGRYDLDKLYQPTSVTKLLNRIESVFKLTDATLGTHFFEEAQALSAKEKEEWKIKYGDDKEVEHEENVSIKANLGETASSNEAEHSVAEEAPKPVSRRTAVGTPSTGLSADKIALLKGWAKLTDEQRALIKDVIVDNEGKVKDLVWVECEESANRLACECDIACPESWSSCPVCASDFV